MAGRPRAPARAFTLIELLVVIGILAVLLGILLPAISMVRTSANTIVCSSNMKTVALEFRMFADGTSSAGRGDSRVLGGGRFWINDFQDRLYHLDEFWDHGEAKAAVLDSSEALALCPAGAPRLRKRKGLPCGRESVEPVEGVSLALNMRLYRAVFDIKGKRLLASPAATHVSERILSHPYVPLVLDVDAQAAVSKGVDPFYIAPPIGEEDDPYESGRYWSASDRHGGKTIVGFVGGHVLTSSAPAEERWDWAYQGEVGR